MSLKTLPSCPNNCEIDDVEIVEWNDHWDETADVMVSCCECGCQYEVPVGISYTYFEEDIKIWEEGVKNEANN